MLKLLVIQIATYAALLLLSEAVALGRMPVAAYASVVLSYSAGLAFGAWKIRVGNTTLANSLLPTRMHQAQLVSFVLLMIFVNIAYIDHVANDRTLDFGDASFSLLVFSGAVYAVLTIALLFKNALVAMREISRTDQRN
jgi:hypothetical protein